MVKGIKAELRKVSWPKRKAVITDTALVLSCAVIIGCTLALLGGAVELLVNLVI